MAVARLHRHEPEDHIADFDDYSLYSNLSDEELMHLAIERSLIENRNSTDTSQATARVEQRQLAVQTESAVHIPNPRVRKNSEKKHKYDFDPTNPPPDYEPDDNGPVIPSSANPIIPQYPLLCPTFRDTNPLKLLIKHGEIKLLRDMAEGNPNIFIEPHMDGWIALHEAAYYGQVECLTLMLDVHPDRVNTCNSKGQSSLFLACAATHVDCVQCLLYRGANPNIATLERNTPLFTACEEQNEEIVELLLKYGATVNTSTKQGQTPLHEAARVGQQNICEMLLQAGAKMNTSDIYGIEPFFTAAQNGRSELLLFLMNNGADINAQANDGATPLYEASKNGEESTVENLLLFKANANQATKSGILPIHVAIRSGCPRIVEMLIPVTAKSKAEKCGISPLHMAAEYNQNEILELLIDADFDVNFQLSLDESKMYEDRRKTALYFAVCNCNLEAASMLLDAGADPNVDTFNPLFVAVRKGPTEMVHLLVEYGANVNAHIPTQPTTFPAVFLLCMRHLSLLRYLMRSGCDAQSCFNCMYGSEPHPHIQRTQSTYDIDRCHTTDGSLKNVVQFCDAIAEPSIQPWAKDIISILLDYVGHVKLCSRLLVHLDTCGDWTDVKEKATPPLPLMQLCRLKIRQLVGVQRLERIKSLHLPGSLIKFLNYDVEND